MSKREVWDAAATMRDLECRLFNRDSEGLLADRLGEREKAWVHESATQPPAWLMQVTGVLNDWIIPELISPEGPCEDSEGFRGHHWTEEEKMRMRRIDEEFQIRNSFGVGLFVGAILQRMLIQAGEATDESKVFGPNFSLLDAAFALQTSSLSPSDLTDAGAKSWVETLHAWLFLARNRLSFNEVFSPIIRRGERSERGHKRLSYRHLRRARRSMLLAGLISSGFSLPDEGSVTKDAELHEEPVARLDEDGAMELYHRSDEELEALLGEMHLRESIQEELRFRLRSSRLSRMLAHLERSSQGEDKDEDEDNGASGNE